MILFSRTSLLTPCFILVALVLTSACRFNNQIPKDEAVKKAEQFISVNGYTNLPADTSKISYELFDQLEENVDSVIKQRSNTLQPKAFCISENKDRWNVGFLLTSINSSELNSSDLKTDLPGRAVIVMKDQSEIRLAHKEPLFSRFEKLPQ